MPKRKKKMIFKRQNGINTSWKVKF